MERVHKANLLVILACVLALSVTTIMSYGMSAKSIKGCGVLVATLVIVAVANFLKISDFAKALVIVLCPSYAVLIYSGLVNGNRIAFLANFITLSMAARYFDKKIIKYYAIQTVSEKLNTAKEQIDKNYDYAQQLEQSFAEVTQAVNDGNKEAKTVQKSMLEMSETVGQASDATAGLLEQMNTITGILNDINAIAGQTNLLSLNASIEAARAGEHGKGFAVVADQIRVLSEDSRKSADSIKEIILTLTETVNGVVDKISAGADAAKNSSVQIEDLIGKLDTVNNSAESATVVVKEEYDVIGEVKRQFDDIQEELDTVAATSEENASMVAEIGNNIVNQTDYVMKLSGSIDSLKESSKKLEEHFNE